MYGKRKAQTALGRPTKKARKADSGVFMPVPKYNLPLKDRSKPGDGVMRITRKMRQNAAFSAAVAVADNGGYQQTAYIPFQLDQLPGYATLLQLLPSIGLKAAQSLLFLNRRRIPIRRLRAILLPARPSLMVSR